MAQLPGRGDAVEVFHLKLWYDAVVQRARPIRADAAAGGEPQYEAFVHFQGWSKRQDSWVHCGRVRPRMIGTDASGAAWLRQAVSAGAIKAGLPIEIRMAPQWVPAEVLGRAARAGTYRARLVTDGTEVTVSSAEIIRRWPIPADPREAAAAAASGAEEGAEGAPAEEGGRKKRKRSGGAEQPRRKRPATKGKKDLMCICRKPSDPNRRWIGCSQCLEWFHPECLQITHTPPPQWTCPACQGGSSEASSGGGGRLADVPDASGVIIRRAFERPVSAVDSDLGEGDRYCICRRSYSAASTAAGPQQFLQCEYCAEWFHFECLGLSEQDVEAIDKWMCPRCSSMDAVLRGAALAATLMQAGEARARPTDHEYYIPCTGKVVDSSALESRELCLLCGGSGQASEFIFCTQCGESFHTACLSSSLASRKKFDKIASRWRCLSCMRCSACEDGTDDNLVVCDVCDRGFHLECIKPKIDKVPEGSWACEDCVQCLSCGSTVPGKGKNDAWHEGYSLCTPCWRLYQKKQHCPICHKVWDAKTQERMIGCDQCEMWTHTACERIDDESYKRLGLAGAKFFCIKCREGKGSKRQEIQLFKKNMWWLSKKSRKRFAAEQSKPAASRRPKKAAAAEPAATEADDGIDPPDVAAGTVDEEAAQRLKKLRGKSNLPDEAELRTWTRDRQTEFWFQRRRFWDKEKLGNCQKACKGKGLWAGGDKTQIVTRLVRSEFFAGLHERDYADFDPNAADIVIPEPELEVAAALSPLNSGALLTGPSGGDAPAAPPSAGMPSTGAGVEAAAAPGHGNCPREPEQQVAAAPSLNSGALLSGPSSADVLAAAPPSAGMPSAGAGVEAAAAPQYGEDSNAPADSDSSQSLSTLQALLEMSSQPEVSAASSAPSPSQHSLSVSNAVDTMPARPVSIHIHVQTLQGKTIKIKTPATATILQVMQVLEEPCGVPLDKQRLLFAGRSLQTSGTLAGCGLEDGATVSLDTSLSDSDDGMTTSEDDSASESDHDEEATAVRRCALCHTAGDRKDQGRLLPCGEDTWVHTNCAVWSAETYEDDEGRLHEVYRALSRGKKVICGHCGESGATVGCCISSCTASFHFKCAVRSRCRMLINKQVYCTKHKKNAKHTSAVMQTSRAQRNFTVARKVVIPPADGRQTQPVSMEVTGRLVGSFRLHRPGQVVFDCPAFHTADAIYPAGYTAVRRFWCTDRPHERCAWRVEISRGRGGQFPVFKAACTSSGTAFFGITPDVVWSQVLASVSDKRSGRGAGKSISAAEFFGLSKGCVREVIERLQDAGGCRGYQFATISRADAHTPEANDSGCARTEVSTKVYGSAESQAGIGGGGDGKLTLAKNAAFEEAKQPIGDIHDRADAHEAEKQASHHPRGGTVNMLPDIMRYRQMKTAYRQKTYVRNSPIHSLGLFAKAEYAAQEMVIEYTGEIIRQKLADKREHQYLQRGIACYLFALDGELIIDSSMKGNSARFINHCCDPNCTARVMNLDGSRRIIFSTVREVAKDEELTYDYKFSAESDPAKRVPCSCGSAACRKWLN